MIGIAFGLRGTLVSDGDIELRAFRRVANEHANRLDVVLDESQLLVTSEDLFGSDRIHRAGFPRAVARALDALLGESGSIAGLETDFRRAAAVIVADIVRPLPDTRETLEQIASLGIPRNVCECVESGTLYHLANG